MRSFGLQRQHNRDRILRMAAKRLGYKAVSDELEEHITNLFTLEFIEKTLPDTPKSRLQKYRLTDLGHAQFNKP